MSSSVTTKEDMYIPVQRLGRVLFWGILAILGCAGWRMTLPFDSACSESCEQNRSVPEQVSNEGSGLFLSQMDLDDVSPVSEGNPVLEAGSVEHVRPAGLVLGQSDDKKKELVIESPVYAPNDPVAWYKFDGNTNDSAGSAHGQLCGSPTYAPGVYDQAISFDGYRDSVQITAADNLFLNIRTGIIITFWQYGKTSTHHRDTLCCSNHTVGLNHPTLAINIGCWKKPGEYNWDCGRLGSCGDRLTGKHRNNSEWSGRWNHWVFTKDALAGKMQVFLNGELLDSRAGAYLPISDIFSFEIGTGWYGGYDGLIDEFRIYDYALSQPELAYIATNDTAIFDKS